ncbi:hypothetical protein D9M68_972600 [compost metagenome]
MAFAVGRVQALHRKQLRAIDTRQQQVPGDGGFAHVPRKVDHSDFHDGSFALSLASARGLVIRLLANASAISLPLRMSVCTETT